jgi:transposase
VQAGRRGVFERHLHIVGNLSASRLVKTRMAKSILDASWSMLRNQLRY